MRNQSLLINQVHFRHFYVWITDHKVFINLQMLKTEEVPQAQHSNFKGRKTISIAKEIVLLKEAKIIFTVNFVLKWETVWASLSSRCSWYPNQLLKRSCPTDTTCLTTGLWWLWTSAIWPAVRHKSYITMDSGRGKLENHALTSNEMHLLNNTHLGK